MSGAWAIDERALLEAARSGDEDAYRRLVEPRRAELHAHCYRTLGSVHDAEDALQDALLRAWRALPRFERRSSTRSWLYKIATNTCLDVIAKRSRQRVVLILREVLGFSAQEVAETLHTTVASVNSAMQRARKTVGERLPEASQQATLRALGDEQLSAIVERYMDAWERGDVDGIVALLAEEATITMPPMATWFQGDGVVVFLTELAFSGRAYNAEGNRRVRVLPTHANGQPAIATYAWNDEAGCYLPTVLQVLTFDGGRIGEITGFVDPSVFPRFALPASLPAA